MESTKTLYSRPLASNPTWLLNISLIVIIASAQLVVSVSGDPAKWGAYGGAGLSKQEIVDRLESKQKPLLEPNESLRLMQQFRRLDESGKYDSYIEVANLDVGKCEDYQYLKEITKIVDKMITDNKSIHPNLVHYLYDCRRKQKEVCHEAKVLNDWFAQSGDETD